jgi:hypothetical protein
MELQTNERPIMNTRYTIAIAAASLFAGIAGTAVVMSAHEEPTPVPVTIVRTVEVVNTKDVDAYGAAVEALRNAGGKGEDLLPHLIHLAEVDNAVRLGAR